MGTDWTWIVSAGGVWCLDWEAAHDPNIKPKIKAKQSNPFAFMEISPLL